MSLALEIARLLLLPGRKICGLMYEMEVDPTICEEIAGTLTKHGVVPILCQRCPSLDKRSLVTLTFVDLTEADVPLEDLAQELNRIRGVKSVKVIHPMVEGLITDTASKRLLVMGDRALIFRKPLYEGFAVGIRRQFGSAGEAFLYYTGYESGIKLGESYRRIAESLGVEDPIEIAQKIAAPVAMSMGFGRAELVEASLRPPQATIRMYENPECELGLYSKKPYSHFIRGIVAGILTQLFGVEMMAEETQCIAKGDPYCEFKVTPKEKV